MPKELLLDKDDPGSELRLVVLPELLLVDVTSTSIADDAAAAGSSEANKGTAVYLHDSH